ncbi:hypothetical protein RIF29_40776 [Crotalaria pallida]|uniref:RIN4 pathogenic type III effector avirulence factor Avr cleavage site domain-containing protein n=1 Tax=Crotalaria pallida TaxID=3830 RepID=A0AAN9E644_CROPI
MFGYDFGGVLYVPKKTILYGYDFAAKLNFLILLFHSHVPKFGNWEEADNIPYTACFENARKEKGGGVMINPNDPMENPEAFNMCKGGYQHVDANNEVKAYHNHSHKQSSLEKRNHTLGHVHHRSRGRQGSVMSGFSSSSHKSHKRGGNSFDEPHRNHQATTVPKFGNWDVMDPNSGEGYSDIFTKIKEEKHSAPSHISNMSTQPLNNSCTKILLLFVLKRNQMNVDLVLTLGHETLFCLE